MCNFTIKKIKKKEKKRKEKKHSHAGKPILIFKASIVYGIQFN